jgi:asparagine synthase (glutamine-hydrolysing)
MNQSIKHRGPDDSGAQVFQHKNYFIGLAHQRLTIIDLSSKGHQPMSDAKGLLWIIYNGEIYNFPELKRDLIKKGYKFRSKSDTEVILYAYKEWGKECLQRFNGIFAFVIWDRNKEECFLARDRLGVKPLIYSQQSWGLLFSSEIRSLISFGKEIGLDINFTGFNYYLSNGFIPAPHTIFKGVRKLRPAHFLVYKDDELQEEKRYWSVDYSSTKKGSLDYFKEGLREKLEQSVKRQMLSDVKVGALLSGGFDSSSIVGMMARQSREQISTFSIGFKDQSYNEVDYARKVAEKYETHHHELVIQPNPLTFFNQMIDSIDEPFADTSSIPTFLVSQMAGKHVKVVLSGDGGDEIFGGYDWYTADHHIRKLIKRLNISPIFKISRLFRTTSNKKGIRNTVKKIYQAMKFPSEMNTMRWHGFFTDEDKFNLLNIDIFNEIRKSPTDYSFYSMNKMDNTFIENMYFDLNLYLPDDILMKVDKMSMANSIESRVPLLDHELIEFTACIPSKYKNNLRGNSKIVFKEAVKDLLPKEIYERKSKQGFSIPFKNWLTGELKNFTEELILSDNVTDDNYFKKSFLKKMYMDHLDRKVDNSHKIRSIMIFLLWKNRLRGIVN